MGVYVISGPNQECMLPEHRFVIGRVAICQDTAGEVLCLPLSYFETPRLGHIGSQCASRIESPTSSVVQGRSSTP
ncbi:hypothetical protein ACFX2I_032038 [Malus domestica]